MMGTGVSIKIELTDQAKPIDFIQEKWLDLNLVVFDKDL